MDHLSLYMRITEGVMAALIIVYLLRFRHHDKNTYSPPAAWLRAAIYWCFCLLVAYCSGALEAALTKPLVTQEQLKSISWHVWTDGLFIFIIWAYCFYWASNTLRFDRKLNVLPQLFFGLAWGITTGLFFLSFWHLALTIGNYFGGWPTWSIWLMAYVLISLWQMFWMDLYWDIWVSPEHDTPESIKQKVPRTHIPNMTLCLTYFALYENYWVFIALQTIALIAASIGQRMPAPWDKNPTPAARQAPGPFGLPHAAGYIGDTPKSQPGSGDNE